MSNKKTKRKMIITLSVVILLIIIAAFIAMYLLTDMFKSDKTLFFKYLGKNVENIETIMETLENEENPNGKYEEKSEIKINYTENLGTTSENTDNEINKLKLTIDGQTDKDNNYNYRNIKLLKNDDKIINMEYLQDNNNYGIRFSDLFNQYLLLENNNLKEFFAKTGLSQEQLEKVPDAFKIDLDILGKLELDEEEIEILRDKYVKIISESASDGKFEKQKNQKITINQKTVFVNAYTLALTKEQLNNMYIKILETLREDEIVLRRIDYLQENINNIDILSYESINLKEQFVNSITKKIEDINKNNIGNEETKIIIYENTKQTVRTTIQGVNYQIDIDIFQNEGRFAEISIKEKQDEIQKITLKNDENKLSINIEDKKQKVPYTLNIDRIKETGTKSTTITYETKELKLETKLEQEIKQVEQIEKVKLAENNSIQLDTLKREELDYILNQIKEILPERIDGISEKIEIEELQEFGKTLGIIQDTSKLEGIGITEAQKNRFNSKFQFLKTEELNNEEMLNTIQVFQDNLINLELVSDTELKLEIDRNNNNEEYVNLIKDFVENDKRKKYNIEIEYDDETGLVKYVVMKIVT